MGITTCVFDAYGTLFDVTAAARQAAAEPGREALAECWQAVARDWRLKQLQYTWLRAVSDAHIDFWQVTQDGLDYALEAHAIGADAELRARLLALYWELSAYRASAAVRALAEAGVPVERLAAVGLGEYHPLVDEATQEAYAMNRRLELRFMA